MVSAFVAKVTPLGMSDLVLVQPVDLSAHPEHPIVLPPGKPDKPEIWPKPGHPEHPIVLPPIEPGGPPIEIGAHPEHPIVLPPPPAGGAIKPPPPDGGWAYTPQWGWGYYPGPTQQGPKT